MLTNSVDQEIRCSIVAMSRLCCVMSRVSAVNTQTAWGLKSSGSFFTHMAGTWLGWLQLAGTLDKGTDMWTLCLAWALFWLDSEKEQAESKRSKRVMFQEKFPGFSWPVPAVTSALHPLPAFQIQGERKQSPPLAGGWRIHTDKELVGWEILWTILIIFGIYHQPCISFRQQGVISCPYKVFCGSRQFSRADVLPLA